MIERRKCSALTQLHDCVNGFGVSSPCFGADGTPICCKEEVCGHIYNATGGRPIPLSEREQAQREDGV